MSQKPKVLIVDDQTGVRTLLDILLIEEGYETITASNGFEACKLVQENQPSLVVMDIRMPVMDGITALKQMKGYDNQLPVIMMTAYSDRETLQEAIEAGAAGFLLKPFDINEVKEYLQNFKTV